MRNENPSPSSFLSLLLAEASPSVIRNGTFYVFFSSSSYLCFCLPILRRLSSWLLLGWLAGSREGSRVANIFLPYIIQTASGATSSSAFPPDGMTTEVKLFSSALGGISEISAEFADFLFFFRSVAYIPGMKFFIWANQ